MDMIDVFKFERAREWGKWVKRIPFFEPKAGWKIAVIPPFGGAVARFRVELPDGRSKSVYLDCYDELGCYGEPYWEVYPVGDDVGRCPMDEVELLIQLIEAPDEEDCHD